MVGKRSCILRTTSSRSLLMPVDESDSDSLTFCESAEVTERGPGPTLSSPCKIVIGFHVGAEKKPLFDVCESPRSVLDSSAVLSTQSKQKARARSPRSGLGSLLAGKTGSEEVVGLCVQSSVGGSKVGSGSLVSKSHVNNQCNGTFPKSSPIEDPPTLGTWPNKVSAADLTNGRIPAGHGQGLRVNSLLSGMKDVILDAEISPIRAGGACMFMTEDQALMVSGASMASVHRNAGTPAPIQLAATHNTGLVHGHGLTQPTPSLLLWQGGLNRGYAITCQNQCWHGTSLDVEEIGAHQSIFSTSSPPFCPRSVARSVAGFLKMCNFCGCSLLLGKDIFMYRGDQPFCSAECRYQRIVTDERNNKRDS